MKKQWTAGIVLLAMLSTYCLANDVTPPTDKILKDQFYADFTGLMKLDDISLKLISAEGNQATWSAEGDMSATEDLYSMVGMAGDYKFMEKNWVKGHQVKFSAMVTSVGTPASGLRTEFFSMQTAAKNIGYPLSKTENKDQYLVITDSNFYPKLARIEASYHDKKIAQEKAQSQIDKVEKQIADLDTQIKQSWGKDANGNPRTRSDVMQEKLQQMYEIDRQNDPLKFENHYYKTVYDPALASCQAKPECDAAPLRAARDTALNEQKREYYRQHALMNAKIKEEMAAQDEKLKPLYDQQSELRGQGMALDTQINQLKSEYERWDREITDLRRKGIIK
ncbi:DUF1202 family protein [Citrobacter freundii]|nr:DUF1202 family protein [Citrobacter freundii]